MGVSAKRTVYPALILAAWRLALGQTAQPRILTIDLENFVEYRGDTSDVSVYGTNAAVTPPAAILSSRDFFVAIGLGDIVAVNGQPAKGLYAARVRALLRIQIPIRAELSGTYPGPRFAKRSLRF